MPHAAVTVKLDLNSNYSNKISSAPHKAFTFFDLKFESREFHSSFTDTRINIVAILYVQSKIKFVVLKRGKISTPRFTSDKIKRARIGSHLEFYLKSKSDFSLE